MKLKQKIMNLFLFFIPYGIYEFYKKNLKSKFTKKNFKFENFGGKPNNEKECIILGNGPSLKETLSSNDYNFIKEKTIFCVNRFPLTDAFFELKPRCVFFMDPSYWSKDNQDGLDELFNEIYNSLLKVTWNIKLVLSKRAQKWHFFIDLPEKNNNISMQYICTIPHGKTKPKEEIFEEYKANISMPFLQNVLVGAIYTAINMGYEKIYLFGADHNWHESIHIGEDNIVYIKDVQFCADNRTKTEYNCIYKDARHTQRFSLHELFYVYARKHEAYVHLNEYAEYMKVKVYNASKYSCIDAFERIKVAETQIV